MGVEKEIDLAADSPEVASEAPDPANYPHGIRLAIIIASLAASVFLCALVRFPTHKARNSRSICFVLTCWVQDETIITTAIPRITDEFSSINDIGWYGSA